MRRSAFLVCLLVVAAVAFADPAAEDSRSAEPISVLYPQSVSSIPVLALLDAFADEYVGEVYTDHPQALAQLLSNQVGILVTGYAVGYNRFQAAGDLVHLSTPVWGASAVMTSKPVDSLEGLAGGTIYAPFEGSPIDIYLRAVLDAEGLSNRVSIAYAPFPQAAALLTEGRTEAAVLVEPIASQLEIAGTAYRLENLHEGWARIADGEQRSPQVSVFARRESFEDSQETFVSFSRSLEEMVERVAADPARYAARYADVLGFPVPVVERALANTLFDTPDPAEVPMLIEEYSAIIGARPPSDDFYAETR
ncbi:MAG: ABC transporter substrate-binding protein [Spirochaetota bacterium]